MPAGRPHCTDRGNQAIRQNAVRGTLGVIRRLRLAGWLALAVVALAGAELLQTRTGVMESLWSGVPGALRLGALLFALAGAAQELRRSYAEHERQLAANRQHLRLLSSQVEDGRRHQEDVAHEARSALAAIQHAVGAMTRSSPRYADYRSLRQAIDTEIGVLRRLLAARPPEPARVFRLIDAVSGPVTAARLQAAEVEVDISPELTVHGCPATVAQVMQGLLENARRHAPGAPIHITARDDGHRVALQVRDDGPGFDADAGRAVFERGATGHGPATGHGLGLHIASELVRGQGGDISIKMAPGAGAGFIISLPSGVATPSRSDEIAVDA